METAGFNSIFVKEISVGTPRTDFGEAIWNGNDNVDFAASTQRTVLQSRGRLLDKHRPGVPGVRHDNYHACRIKF